MKIAMFATLLLSLFLLNRCKQPAVSALNDDGDGITVSLQNRGNGDNFELLYSAPKSTRYMTVCTEEKGKEEDRGWTSCAPTLCVRPAESTSTNILCPNRIGRKGDRVFFLLKMRQIKPTEILTAAVSDNDGGHITKWRHRFFKGQED